jgi:hypothetical protein
MAPGQGGVSVGFLGEATREHENPKRPMTSVDPTKSTESLLERAERALEEILAAVTAGAPVTLVASPPGAGKTFTIELVGAQQAALAGEVVAVATSTRSQGRELAQRLTHWEGFTPVWFVPKSQRIADPPPGVQIARSVSEIPTSHAVVVATAAKWSRTNDFRVPLAICDEAWQLSFSGFAPLSPIAERFLLVGDPGQIAPVVQVDISRWSDDPAGPHVSAPVALRRREIPGLVEVALPATRRLPADSAAIVSDAFYPDTPFGSLAPPATLSAPNWPSASASLAVVEIGAPRVGAHDPWLADEVAALVAGVVADGVISDASGSRGVAPGDVGVVCPYVHQVPVVRAALGGRLGDVFVETANRWQGLERAVVIGIHPLSGQPAPSGFAMDAGRLCVMCSRHKVASVLVGRPGLTAAAAAGQGSAERRFGDAADPARAGWLAHTRLLEDL